MSDPRPQVGPYTEALYRRLPDVYRDADAAQDEGASNYPLLRFLSLIGDQLTPIATILERLTYRPLDDRDNTDDPWDRYGLGLFGEGTYGDGDTADLVDPYRADTSWLPWLAQLLGVPITGLTHTEAREALADPSRAWAHGTPEAIADQARKRLGDDAYVNTAAHYREDPFTIALITKASEGRGTTFREHRETAPTWRALMEKGPTWRALQTTNIVAAAEAERPAGYRLEHAYLETFDNTPAPPPPTVDLLAGRGTFETEAQVAAWTWNPAWGYYPEETYRIPLIDYPGGVTEGSSAMLVIWPINSGGLITLALTEGIVPGFAYKITADVRIPTGETTYGNRDVGVGFLYKTTPVKVTTRDEWTTVESEVWVADATSVYLAFSTAGPYGGAAAPLALIDNVRLTIV